MPRKHAGGPTQVSVCELLVEATIRKLLASGFGLLAWSRTLLAPADGRSVHRETIIRASLTRFTGPPGSNEIIVLNGCWTRTVMVDPDAPTVVGVVVTVTLKGARLWTYVCTAAWTAGDALELPWTDAHRAPSCARSETMLYCQTPIPKMMCPEEGHEKHCRRQCELDKVCSPVVAHAPAPAGLR